MTAELDAAAKARSANLNETIKTEPAAAAAEFVSVCGFEDFLFFCLCFAKVFTMALWPRNNKGESLKSDIMLKIR